MTSGGSAGVAGAQGGSCASPESCDDDRTPLFNSFVTRGEQQFRDIAAANDGKFALAMVTWWDIDFGPPTQPLVARGNYDPVLAVFDASGTPVWSTLLGDPMPQQVTGVAFDADGHLLATGNFQGSFSVGGQELQASSEDVLLAKFDRDGEMVWARLFGGDMDQVGTNVVVAPDGNIVVVGYFRMTIDFGDVTTTGGEYDVTAFVAMFDPNGNHLWHRALPSFWSMPQGVVVDHLGNVTVAGNFSHFIDLGDGTIDAGPSNLFLLQLDSSGQYRFGQIFAASTWTRALDLAVDPYGNLLLAGDFAGQLDLGAGAMDGDHDAFVAKLDANGNPLWSRVVPCTGDATAYEVAADGLGNVLVAASFAGSLETNEPLHATGQDAAILKFDADGNEIASRSFGGMYTQEALGVAVDDQNNVLLGGQFKGEIILGSAEATAAADSSYDTFVVRLGPRL